MSNHEQQLIAEMERAFRRSVEADTRAQKTQHANDLAARMDAERAYHAAFLRLRDYRETLARMAKQQLP